VRGECRVFGARGKELGWVHRTNAQKKIQAQTVLLTDVSDIALVPSYQHHFSYTLYINIHIFSSNAETFLLSRLKFEFLVDSFTNISYLKGYFASMSGHPVIARNFRFRGLNSTWEEVGYHKLP